MNVDAAPGRLYALLGDPVHHSLSSLLHNTAFKALGINAQYISLRTWPELVAPLMRALAIGGGGGNVTLPHKRAAAQALDHASQSVRATGACNAFWWEDGRGLSGDNTDVAGFRAAAEHLLGQSLQGSRVLLLGAGGAAHAVVHACRSAGEVEVDVVNRTRAAAEALREKLGGPLTLRVLESAELNSTENYDLIVNATSLGLHEGDPLPVDLEVVRAAALLDLVYAARETRLVQAARSAGLSAGDGRRMLVEQAALSFERWLRRAAPRALMFAALGLRE